MLEFRADTRREELTVLRYRAEARRRSEGLSLAYNGLSPFVSAIVDRARNSRELGVGRSVGNLVTFMERFAVLSEGADRVDRSLVVMAA